MAEISRIGSLLANTALAGTLMILAAPQLAFSQDEGTATARKAGRVTVLDKVVISTTQIDESVVDALAAESSLDRDQIERVQADNAAELFRAMPGVAATANGDDPATAINIRGMQQSGRVVVTVDGARQDYWRVGHGSGSFYIEPEILKQTTVIRGPASNSYGSGAIGGVVAFETMDASDFLNFDEQWALSEKLAHESNGRGFTTSTIGAVRLNDDVDMIGNIVYRDRSAYTDGNGATVPWTGESVLSGYAKGTFRPADGHELKLGVMQQSYEDFITGSSGSPSATLSRYDANTVNRTYTASYTYQPDENDLIDLDLDMYHNTTRADQAQVWPSSRIGSSRYYEVATTGFNATNSSRFEGNGISHTVTYGADSHHTTGTSDAAHFGAGTQDAYGAFLQWKGERNDWLEIITALRYDNYKLNGQLKTLEDATLSGDRWSPRVTVGVTPVQGLQVYGTYSEGYRAPTLQNVFRGGGAHGASNSYIPNILLQPEVAKSWEAGINLKYDDVFTQDDALRAKINLFHTAIDDYIDVDLTDPVRTAQNLGNARLRGVEVEGLYDFSWGFVNMSGALIDAQYTSGVYAGQTLSNTPLDKFSATLGFRALEEQLTFGAEFMSVGEITRTNRSSPTSAPTTNSGFQLVNLFADWRLGEHLKLGAGIDNVFDVAYTDPQSAWSTRAVTEQGRGRTFKISITGRIGG